MVRCQQLLLTEEPDNSDEDDDVTNRPDEGDQAVEEQECLLHPGQEDELLVSVA